MCEQGGSLPGRTLQVEVVGWITAQVWYPMERLGCGQMRSKLAKPRTVVVGPSRRHGPRRSRHYSF